MESKVSTEQHEAAAIDEKEPTARSDPPQLRRLSKRAYLASTVCDSLYNPYITICRLTIFRVFFSVGLPNNR
jgi:hypothetical protein